MSKSYFIQKILGQVEKLSKLNFDNLEGGKNVFIAETYTCKSIILNLSENNDYYEKCA
jgi:hypothetical protein